MYIYVFTKYIIHIFHARILRGDDFGRGVTKSIIYPSGFIGFDHAPTKLITFNSRLQCIFAFYCLYMHNYVVSGT